MSGGHKPAKDNGHDHYNKHAKGKSRRALLVDELEEKEEQDLYTTYRDLSYCVVPVD